MSYIIQFTTSLQIFACVKFCHRNAQKSALRESLYFERINVKAGSNLFKHLFSFEILMKETFKGF